MTNISTHAQNTAQINRLKNMQSALATLQYQLNTEKKSDKFAGLGGGVIASTRARANFNEIDTYTNNMAVADRRIKMQVNAMSSILKQAGDVVNAIQIQTQEGEFEIESVGDLAKKARDIMISMLNERDGDRYLFAGADSQTKPLIDTGLQGTYLDAQVSQWINGNIDTDQLMAAYKDKTQLTDTINGYSAALSSGNARNVYVRVEENTELDYTVLANNDGFRDIITAFGMLDSLCSNLEQVSRDVTDAPGTVTAPGATKQEQAANFYKVFNDIAVTINKGMDKLETETFKLSQVAARMTQMTDDYALEKKTLTDVIADVENVDPNEVAVKLSTLMTQIEASYRVTASVSKLSLAYVL